MKRRTVALIILVAQAVPAAGAAKTASPLLVSDPSVKYNIRVADSVTGLGVPGATVTCCVAYYDANGNALGAYAANPVKTNAQGRVIYYDDSPPVGAVKVTYTCTVSVAGYTTFTGLTGTNIPLVRVGDYYPIPINITAAP